MRRSGLSTKSSSLCGFVISCILCVGQVYGQAQYDARSSVYQYSAPVGSGQAYLWIPPKCEQVRGLIISFANMLERHWCEDPVVRKASARNGLGILIIEPSARGVDPNLTSSGKQAFLQLLKALADSSGYSEIAKVPFIPIDHSVHSVFCWNLCAWLPQRVIAAIPVKGQPIPDDANIAGKPFCYIIGENDEWPLTKDGKPFDRNYIWPYIRSSVTVLRKKDTNNLVGVATDPGGGHLDWPPRLSKLMAIFIDKACKYRIRKGKGERNIYHLLPIDPQKGWLTDTGGLDPDRFKPAPYLRYKGNRQNAYWFFDEEMARAAMDLAGDHKARKMQMVGFKQRDIIVDLNGDPYVSLAFQPEKDRTIFGVRSAFLDHIPRELSGAGRSLSHSKGQIRLSVICGPARQIASGLFMIDLDRSGLNDIWLMASHSGDHDHGRAVQPARIRLAVKLTPNDNANISFELIGDQHAGRSKEIQLRATCTTGSPVSYFVNSGPAIVKGDKLLFTAIPKRSRYPITVTVTAWYWTFDDLAKAYHVGTVSQSFQLTK